MNMIPTAFPSEVNAFKKEGELVSRLVGSWEEKNSKTACRVGGLSLMAISLAACTPSDPTVFSQADVTAAAAQATKAAQDVAATAAVEAAAVAANATAEAAAAAATALAAAVAIAKTEGIAEGVASVDITSDNAAIAATAKAEGISEGVASVDITSDNAAIVAAAEALKDAQIVLKDAEIATKVAELATLQATYDNLVAPKTLSTQLTSAETLTGGHGDDTFTGAGTSFTNADKLRDPFITDNDSANLTVTGNITPDVASIENINLTINSTGPKIVNASSISRANTLTLTRGDVEIAFGVIPGDLTHDIDLLDASHVPNVIISGSATSVSLDQTVTAGVVLDADVATGSVNVIGAATIKAAGAGTGDTVTVTAADEDAGTFTTAENAKAVTVSTGAETVSILTQGAGASADDFTGAISVTGASTKNVKIAAASGGATVNVLGEAGVVGVDGVVIVGIDETGSSVTTSFVGTSSSKGVVSLDGSSTSDVATVSAVGVNTLNIATSNQIEILNLSGNGAAVTYEVTGAATTYNIRGDKDVTISGAELSFDGKTITDSSTGTSTLKIITLDDADLSQAAVDNIIVAANGTAKTLTLADNSTITLASDLTTSFSLAGKAAGYTVNLETADDTFASGAPIDIVTGNLTLSFIDALNINAKIGNLTATTTTASSTTAIQIFGTKDVTLGSLIAQVVASTSTGDISFDAASTALQTVVTGAGDDTIVMDQAAVVSVVTGAGDDEVTAASSGSSTYSTGAGSDTFNLNTANAIVIDTGNGVDTVIIADDVDSNAIISGGAGDDTLIFLEDSLGSVADSETFAISSFEKIEIIDGGITMNAAQFSNNREFKLIGNSAVDDVLSIINTGTAGAIIDASKVTFDATPGASLNLSGKADLQDTITGSAKDDVIIGTTGGDLIDGDAGVDTFLTASLKANNIEGGTSDSNGIVINLGTTAVTKAAVLSAIGSHTADAVTSVASGAIAYTFASSGATNSAVTSSISNVENLTGTSGADYIVGSLAVNIIDGGVGADYIAGGLAGDTITGGGGNDTIDLGVADGASDTVVIEATALLNGTDTVTNFEVGSDKIDITAFETVGAVVIGTGSYTVAAGQAVFLGSQAAGSADSSAAAIVALNAAGTVAAAAAGTKNFVLIADDNSAALYSVSDDGVADEYTGNTFTLVSTFDDAIIASTDLVI
ncbi:hypothetical protein N9E97_02435 [Planktomarina sp.]|nr:hypothetical protein [Planktomarina sp.]